MTIAATHPDDTTLAAFAVGRLVGDEAAQVEQHVSDCPACAARLGQVSDDSLARLARDAAAAPDITAAGTSHDTPAPAIDAAPSDSPPELRDHPRYRILSRLGAGGMGVVYKAEHMVMGRTVALKVINQRLLADPSLVDRFRREVRAAARLSHPHIVTAYDAEQAGDLHFLVMEFVEGLDLAHLVARRGPQSPDVACHLARQVALGLQHAHERGMVHRDIKPHNLLVNRKGHLKILDFGLARLSADPSSGQVVSTAGLTNPSFVLGTPDFVAPEQARDSTAVDIRADLYSLGCTLYYLLTGKPPYPTGSVIEKLFQHCESCPPRASDLRSDIPAEVESVLQKLLAKNPDDRYQTPAELAQALAPLIRPGSGTTPTNRTMPVIAASPPRSETRAIRRPLAAGAPEEVVVTEPVAKPSKLTRKSKSKKQRKKAFPLPIVPLILLLALPLLGYAGYRAAAPWISKLTADAATSKTPPPGEPVVNRPLPEMTPGPSSTAPPRSQDASPSSSSGPMVLLVVPHRGLWHADYHPVKALLDKAGYHTETVSSEYGVCQAYPAPGNDGPDVLPQNLITNVHPPMYEAVVFVGATTSAFEDSSTPAGRATRQLIEVLTKAGKPVSAICAGQKVLVSQGYLKGKSAARNQYTVEHPGADTVNWIDTAVKQDGNIITGADADAAEPFVKTLITAMRQGSGEKSISPAGAAKPPSASPGPKLSEYGPPPFTPPPPPRPRFQPGQKPPPGSFFPRQKPPMGQGRASD